MNQLRIWWIPQMPGKSFYMNIDSIGEGVKILNTLGLYDEFQYKNGIKPDYSNAGGLQMLEDEEWVDWEIESVDFGYYDDPESYLQAYKGS